jgi:hypothetical protein
MTKIPVEIGKKKLARSLLLFLYILSVTNQPNHIDIYVYSLFDYSAQQWAL